MIRYIAFLRGINVSGQKLIKMEDLREHFKMPGFKNIATYIQSGNVLFDTAEADEKLLRSKIEKRLLQKTGHEIPTILRTLDEIRATIKNNPFAAANDETRKLYVSFLESAPEKKTVGILEGFLNEYDEAKVISREVYILTSGYADTRFSNTFVEKKLGLSATTRNWATVNKVLEL